MLSSSFLFLFGVFLSFSFCPSFHFVSFIPFIPQRANTDPLIKGEGRTLSRAVFQT